LRIFFFWQIACSGRMKKLLKVTTVHHIEALTKLFVEGSEKKKLLCCLVPKNKMKMRSDKEEKKVSRCSARTIKLII
jgi:hypothetical protein